MRRCDDQHLTALLRAPLLSAEQEIQLGRRVQRWQELLIHRGDGELKAWARRCGITTTELSRACRSGLRARDRMILGNTRLVASISRRHEHRRGNLDHMDLFQHGIMGLYVAVIKFDPTRGYKLSTYATRWIEQAVKRAIQRHGSAVRIPEHIHLTRGKVVRYAEEALVRGEHLTFDQAFQALGLSNRIDYVRAAEAVRYILSTDSVALGMKSDTTIIESVAAPAPDADADQDPPFQLGPEHHELLQAVDGLSRKSANVVRLRYGIGVETESTIDEIAATTGSTPQAVRSALQKAIPRLRTALSPAEQ